MEKIKLWFLIFCFHCTFSQNVGDKFYVSFENSPHYLPTWDSLDSRPLPPWYDEAKIGIFIHWGVFSVPSFGSEWFWIDWLSSNKSKYSEFMNKNYPPGFTYQDFAKDFTTEFFDPQGWANLFKLSGAKYVVLTSKHHEGYTMWPSKYSFSWNSKDVGPHRDLVGDLSKAVREAGLNFGLYHSLYEWFNPIYLSDKNNNYKTKEFPQHKIIPEMMELVNNYLPDVLWSDGDWEGTDDYWQSKEFLAWLYNDSPVKNRIVVNDRWGKDIGCHHGDFYSCADRYNPGVLQKHKWENAMTIDKESWGYRREANLYDYMSIEELLKTLIETISCGGNILMNIGPTKEGTIVPIFQERLLQVGEWLSINGEAIYKSKPWKYQNETETPVWYTSRDGAVYATLLKWPASNVLKLEKARQLFFDTNTKVVMLGAELNFLEWAENDKIVDIVLPDKATIKGQWAWVLKIWT